MYKSDLSKNLELQRKLNKAEEKLDRSHTRIMIMGFVLITLAVMSVMSMVALDRSYDSLDRLHEETSAAYFKCDSLKWELMKAEAEAVENEKKNDIPPKVEW